MNKFARQPEIAEEGSITPDILAATLRVVHPEGVVLIKGIVTKATPWGQGGEVQWVYGTLGLDGFVVSFKSSPHCAPKVGDAVVMKGVLELVPVKAAGRDRWRADYELRLNGAKVGNWTPETGSLKAVQIGSRPDRVPLNAFIEGYGPAALTILASEAAEADVLRSLTAAGLLDRPAVVRAPFNDEARLLKAAKQAVADGADGLALARGGGAGLELIANSPSVTQAMIDLGVPFFSAMGHGEDIFLVDKHADQSFHTPSELGTAVARAFSEAAEHKQLLLQLSYASRRANEMSEALNEARANEVAVRASEAAARDRAAEAQRQSNDLSIALARRVHAHAHGISLSWPVLGGVAAVGVLVLAGVALFL